MYEGLRGLFHCPQRPLLSAYMHCNKRVTNYSRIILCIKSLSEIQCCAPAHFNYVYIITITDNYLKYVKPLKQQTIPLVFSGSQNRCTISGPAAKCVRHRRVSCEVVFECAVSA